MTIRDVLLPVFVQAGLTFTLLLWMALLRTQVTMAGVVKLHDIALREPNWPPGVTQIANAFHNQLELPVLFYAVVALALETQHAGTLFVTLAWIFVFLRLIHAAIHVTSNTVRVRGTAFILGAFVLGLMWASFALEVVFGIVVFGI
jgi:hypothetical protein